MPKMRQAGPGLWLLCGLWIATASSLPDAASDPVVPGSFAMHHGSYRGVPLDSTVVGSSSPDSFHFRPAPPGLKDPDDMTAEEYYQLAKPVLIDLRDTVFVRDSLGRPLESYPRGLAVRSRPGRLNVRFHSSAPAYVTVTLCDSSGAIEARLWYGWTRAGSTTLRLPHVPDVYALRGRYYVVLEGGGARQVRPLLLR